MTDKYEQLAKESLIEAVKIIKSGILEDVEPSKATLAHRAILKRMKPVSGSVIEDCAVILASAWICVKEDLNLDAADPFLANGTPLVELMVANGFAALDFCEIELYEDLKINLRILNEYVDFSVEKRIEFGDLIDEMLDGHKPAKNMDADEVLMLQSTRDLLAAQVEKLNVFLKASGN